MLPAIAPVPCRAAFCGYFLSRAGGVFSGPPRFASPPSSPGCVELAQFVSSRFRGTDFLKTTSGRAVPGERRAVRASRIFSRRAERKGSMNFKQSTMAAGVWVMLAAGSSLTGQEAERPTVSGDQAQPGRSAGGGGDRAGSLRGGSAFSPGEVPASPDEPGHHGGTYAGDGQYRGCGRCG